MPHCGLVNILLLFALVVCMPPAYAAELAQQRQTYRLAQLALVASQEPVFQQLKARLKSYPLYPYLIYEELKQRLGSAPDAEVESFLNTYADTPLAYLMRGLWLYELYQQDRWQKFLEVYDGRAVIEYTCYDLRARIRAQQLDGVIRETKQLWLVGISQDSACDRLFEWFETQPEFTTELVWKRIELAMDAGNIGLAGYLGEKLSAADQAWVRLWQRADSDPQTTLEEPALKIDQPRTRKILIHAVLCLSDDDIDQGKAAWDQIRSEYDFDSEQRDEVDRSIALLAAYRHRPQALAWLDALPASARNEDVNAWRARMAMRDSDWETVRESIKALKDTSDEPLMWKYWKARALEGTGDAKMARKLYKELAQERDYYGFLAADWLGVGYSMNNKPLVKDPAEVGALVDMPGIRRAYELLRVDQETDARREWNYALSSMSLKQKKLAAVLASKWNWYSDAIRTVALVGDLDDLELRFPTPYRDEVALTAQNRELDPAWIYSIMRRESAFAPDAYSSAGALGLMQLLPSTAALTAQKFGFSVPSESEVFDPARNIALGSAYLSELLKRFNGNQALATAAYNAGPYRVASWLPKDHALAADAWVDTIPFYETRDYVKAVLAYAAVYESELGGQPTPLTDRMEPIPLPTSAEYAHK